MANIPTPQDIEILAVNAGISVAEACKRAEMMPAVFTRWKRGVSNPGIENVRAIVEQLEAAIQSRNAA
ncbi:MAG: hypothetical protein NTX56_04265 [Proteobacteria bacterium]|nr:hypothetical protein [Pseudomonadota bacterium]